MDIFSRKKRSEIMKAVKSKETTLEKQVRSELTHLGLKYRKNVLSLEGKPDIAFIGKKMVVFIDSCFWHGCSLHFKTPMSNQSFWRHKIARNRERDKKVTKSYRKKGWKIVRIWEHEIKRNPQKVINKIVTKLN